MDKLIATDRVKVGIELHNMMLLYFIMFCSLVTYITSNYCLRCDGEVSKFLSTVKITEIN